MKTQKTKRNRTAPSRSVQRLVRRDLLAAAKKPDWGQVICNGGPPCFHIADGKFCFRAKRWQGHERIRPDSYHDGVHHKFVSLSDMLRSIAPNDEPMSRPE